MEQTVNIVPKGQTREKEIYVSPQIAVVEMEVQNIIATSGGNEPYNEKYFGW